MLGGRNSIKLAASIWFSGLVIVMPPVIIANLGMGWRRSHASISSCSQQLFGSNTARKRQTVKSPSRSGVFQANADTRMESYAESISFDRRLYQHDIRGSIAHAEMLASVGMITSQEFVQIRDTLCEIESELDRDELPLRYELEDIHMHIEQALIDRIGDVGRKLHTARSRNDQVSTDIRMWIRDHLDLVDRQIEALQRAFLGRCETAFNAILPA